MPDTFTFEEGSAPAPAAKTFSFEEAQPAKTFSFEDAQREQLLKTFSFEEAQAPTRGPAEDLTGKSVRLGTGYFGPDGKETIPPPDANRYSYNTESRGEMASPDWEFVKATHGDPILALPIAAVAKALGSDNPEEAPFKPLANLPHFGTAELSVLPPWGQKLATAYNAVAEDVAGLSAPETAIQLPFASNKGMQLAFLGQMAGHFPELAENVSEAKTPQDRITAWTHLVDTAGMAGLLAHGLSEGGAAKPPEKIPVQWRTVQTSEPGANNFSEFGGEVKEEPAPASPVVPGTPATIAAQVDATEDPNSPKAVTLVTPGAKVPEEHNLVEVITAEGTALVNADKINPADAKEQIDAGGGGTLLGMSTEQKPAGGTAVLQTRNADGVVLQDEVVNPATLPAAVEAGKRLAPEGTQELRTPADVIAERRGPLSSIERKYLAEDVAQRNPVSAEMVQRAGDGFALPEGYELKGDQFVYTEPPIEETPAERQGREQREALAGLREQATQPIEAQPKLPITRTERVEPGVPIQTFERPPDILDDLDGLYGRGVRIPEAADFDAHRAAVKEMTVGKTAIPETLLNAVGLGKGKLKRLFQGEAPDTAIEGLHLDGRQLRVNSPEELFDAMIGAARNRLEWAEREKAAEAFKPEVDDPWQATIDKLNSLKVDTRGQLHAFGLLPEAWNQLIELVKLGVKGGKVLSEAIDWAIAKFKEQGAKFDEAGAREHLNANLKESNLTARVLADPTVPDAVKAAADPLYEQKPLPTTADQANTILQQRGLDGAIAEHNGNPNLPEDVRVALGAFIDDHMRTQAAVARVSGNIHLAELWEQRQVDFFNGQFRPEGTELGRAVNAFKLFGANSAQTWLKKYVEAIGDAAGNRFDRVKAAVDNIIGTVRQANAEALRDLQVDRQTNAGVPAAVDEAVAQSPETHRAVIMDMTGPWSESPEIVRMAREQVRAKADELLNKGPRPPGLNPAQHLRVIMDDLAKRAAEIASGHYQGAEPGVTLKDKLVQRLGLGEDAATRLAKRLDDEFSRQMKSATEQLDKRIAKVRAHQGVLREATLKLNAERRALAAVHKTVREAAVRAAQAASDRRVADTVAKRDLAKVQEEAALRAKAVADRTLREAAARAANAETALRVKEAEMMKWSSVERSIHQELRDWNEKLGEIIRRDPTAQEAQGKHVADRIVDQSGLSGPKADKLRALLRNRWDAITSEKKQAALARLQSPAARKLAARPGMAQRIIELSNMGAFDNEKIYNAVKERMKLPTYDPAVAREITRRANELQKLPKGSLQQAKGAEDLMAYVARQHGMKPWEIAQSYWYANLLSGLSTQAKVVIYNLTSIGAHTFTQMVQHPSAIPQIIEALGRALPRGVDTAGALLRDGTVPGIGVKMFEHGHGIERMTGPIASKVLIPWKVMLRSLGAQHLLLFKPATEIKALVLAREMARSEGAVHTSARAREILGWTDRAHGAAEAQAESEGLKGIDYRRRVQEILEQARPPQLQAAAAEWAKRGTAVSEPYGVLGAITKGFDTAAKSAPILNLIVPFRKIVANVANDALGWTPLGWAERMLEYRRKGTMFGNEVNADQLADAHAQAIAGTLGLTALAYAAANGVLSITAQGPATPEQRKTLHSTTGWIPYSIKIGSQYVSYMDRPWGIPLAMIGHYMDAMKYQKLDQESALNRVAYASLGARSVILDSGWLQGLAGIFNQADAYSTKNAAEKVGTQFAKTASGFVPMSQLLKQVDRTFDPQVYDSDGIRAKFLMQLPFVRKAGNPVLNRFGQPMTSTPLDQFLSKEKPDPMVSLLLAKKALPSDIGKGELTNDEYYALVKRAGPMFYKALVENAADIAGHSPREAKAIVERLSNQTTAEAKQALGLDTVEKLRKQ